MLTKMKRIKTMQAPLKKEAVKHPKEDMKEPKKEEKKAPSKMKKGAY